MPTDDIWGTPHSFLVTGYLTRDTRDVTGYFSGISSVTGYSVTGYFSGNGEIMGIALRPPVGEILAISRSKSIENPLLFVNSECIWSSRIVKKIRLRRAETKKIAPAAGNPVDINYLKKCFFGD